MPPPGATKRAITITRHDGMTTSLPIFTGRSRALGFSLALLRLSLARRARLRLPYRLALRRHVERQQSRRLVLRVEVHLPPDRAASRAGGRTTASAMRTHSILERTAAPTSDREFDLSVRVMPSVTTSTISSSAAVAPGIASTAFRPLPPPHPLLSHRQTCGHSGIAGGCSCLWKQSTKKGSMGARGLAAHLL